MKMLKNKCLNLVAGATLGLALACSGSVQANTIVAQWDFDVTDANDLGTTISSTTDSASGLVATPHPSNSADPVYASGVSGVGTDASVDMSGISGLLEVTDPSGTLSGHDSGGSGLTSLQIDIDVNMNTTSSSTWAILRNGHIDAANPGNVFNLYTQSTGAIGFIVRGTAGFIQGRTVASGLLDPNAGWQHITATWDGSQVTIALEGVPQILNSATNETFIAGNIGALVPSDASMGIGGLRRSGTPGSIGQFLDGAVDNLIISTDVPEPGTLAVASLGALAVMSRGRLKK